MTSPITGASGASQAAGVTNTATAPATTGKNQLGKDTFLKLLVAQLKYQDPSHPADGTEFLAQTAQFTMVEKLTDLATVQQEMLATQQILSASSLVGRTVSYTNANGIEAAGVVSSAKLSGSSPTLRVGNTDVPLSSVREVRNAAS
jgi:flagellar basal-body rod modification protein FlgD